MSRILIVDDEAPILKSLKRVLRLAPCTYGNKSYTLEIFDFNSPAAALEAAQNEEFDLFRGDVPHLQAYQIGQLAVFQHQVAVRLCLPDG